MNWKTQEMGQDEAKVFTALDEKNLTWRTLAGIARQTGLSENRVAQILAKYNPALTTFLDVPSISGSPLVGLTEIVG